MKGSSRPSAAVLRLSVSAAAGVPAALDLRDVADDHAVELGLLVAGAAALAHGRIITDILRALLLAVEFALLFEPMFVLTRPI